MNGFAKVVRILFLVLFLAPFFADACIPSIPGTPGIPCYIEEPSVLDKVLYYGGLILPSFVGFLSLYALIALVWLGRIEGIIATTLLAVAAGLSFWSPFWGWPALIAPFAAVIGVLIFVIGLFRHRKSFGWRFLLLVKTVVLLFLLLMAALAYRDF